MSRLEIEELTVEVGEGANTMTAVDRVSLTLAEGAVLGLVGESGSGKSTLARAAVGLLDASGGRILLDGVDVTHGRGRRAGRRDRRRIQMVFQDPRGSLDPRMSIGDTIAEAMLGGPRSGRRGRQAEVARWLDLVGLEAGCAGLLPRTLSGGQRQRVALARALAVEPDVIIADEITSALDVSVQGSVLNLVRDLQRELGLAMLFISHNLAVVRYVSDEVAVMHLGQIVETAPTEELIGAPLHPYTRALLGSVPQLGGSLDDVAVAVIADGDTIDRQAVADGCSFQARCPVGPACRPDRFLCINTDPQVGAASRPHRAACHYIEDPAPAGSNDPEVKWTHSNSKQN